MNDKILSFFNLNEKNMTFAKKFEKSDLIMRAEL